MMIYKATNPFDGKFYIGKSVHTLKSVMRRHLKGSNNPKCHFHRMLLKIGFENFKWEIIDTSATTDDELQQLEISYIEQLGCFVPAGYNSTLGGDGGSPSQDVRDKISKANKGKIAWNKGKVMPKLSEDHRANLSKSLLGIKKNPNRKKRIKQTDEHNKKISESIKNHWLKRKGLVV